ncbi:hypothetical protein GLOIN_2v1777499 [Rhizophagus clarus]|uniref:RNase H type-1 domain-containing protein n=1 Tax=Rhizophagus clarus TaxID=94130 RepID=A0A8H3R1H2_9GLOM|nr:hypothetical protein GLOIN_2v1777499 [Rhizophagus clarus]
MSEHNIDFYGFSETNITKRQAEIWQKQLGFHGYFSYSQQGGKGQGVGIIVHADYNIFVHKAVADKNGRLIYLDLYFSQNKKLRLIQVYVNANKKERSQIENLYEEIEKTVDDVIKNHMEIIIMGDFNINYQKYLSAFVNNRWYYSLFRMLEGKHCLDTLPLFNDNDEDIITYTPSDPTKQPARLDYIWASLPAISKCLDCSVIENDYFKTDHKTIMLSIDTAALIGRKTAKMNKKKKKITRTVFAYDEMDKEDHDDFRWDNFKKELDARIDQLDLKSRKITKRRHIDSVWDCLRQIIMKAAKEKIKNREVVKNKIKTTPEQKLAIYYDLRYIINRIQEICSLKRKLRNVPDLEMIDRWTRLQVTISKLKDKYGIITTLHLLTFNDNSHFTLYLKELNDICKHLRHVFKIELHILEQEQIVSSIKKCCVNYKDDQAKMITFITEKEMAHISIEKIYKKDHNNNESLITDESEVLRETNHHFQTIVGSVNKKKPIQGRWKKQYKPLDNVNDDIYSDIMNLPSKDEWLDIIRNTPNGKAAGPSGISNEILKHLCDDCHDILYYLICKIIEFGYLPKQWKQATANQFAGLPKQSTFEPIRIVNELLQDANDNNNELWILSQDMGKAYDRVNTFQLKKAMERIRIPTAYTSLILELFKDRQNQVVTAYGKTPAYDVLTGIDQGEVISPILWCIYYDPLLAKINKHSLGYTFSTKNITKAQEEPTEILQQNIPVMAYMDDTQWITDEKHKLEKMLYIADSFYRLNDIQINKDKSELMMRAKKRRHRYSHNYNDKILIQFGRDHINIKAKHPCEPTRILGVHFNIENDNRYLISKIKTEVDHLTNLMYKKKITDKHILYIFNRIIIPRIEYWSQVTVLSKKDTENLIIPFRRMFKNKLKFAQTAPNAILDNPYIYGYRNLYENQLQVKITEFCIQLNDTGVLGKVTQIRLKSLQIQLWSSTNLVQKIPFDKLPRSMRNNYLLNMSLLCKDNNISFNIINRNEFSNIDGGKVPLTDVVSNKFYSEFRPTLRRNLILFLNQVISGDKSRLLLWADIINKYYYPQDTNNKGTKEAKWYKHLKPLITVDGYNLHDHIKQLFTARFDNVEDSHPYDIEKRDRSLVAIYNPHHNSFLLGKVHKFNNDDSVVLKHFISDFSLSTIDRTYVSQCDIPHCNANISTKGSICTFTAQHQHLVPLLTARKFTKEKIKESHYINYNAFNLFDIAKKKFELSPSPLSNSHVTTMHQQDNIILDILKPSPSRNKLLIIQRTLAVCNNPNRHIFEFYTDGSLINPGSEQCSISCSFALLQNIFDIPEVEFSCTFEKWPSAYRGELLAVTLALIVVPPNSKVMIKTDSLNVISQFEQLKKSRFSQSAREYFKTNNNVLWNVLIRIITKLNLLVELFKVPAHADCDGNNYADKLTKDAHFDQDNHILFKSDATTMKLLPQWNGITIENKLKRFIRTTTTYKGLEKFINLRRNTKYRKLEVDWTSTFQCLNCDIQNNETSMSSSKIKAQKVHLLIEEIPTIIQMKKSFLEIYDDWKCPSCGLEDETFNHVWSCDEHKNTLLRIRNRTIDLLVYWILECDSHLQNVPVASSLHSLHIWDIGYNINEFTFIDLIKSIIPSMLYHTINSWITKDNSIKILIQMRQYIFEQTFTEVWLPRCSYLKEFERSLGLTKKKKLTLKNFRSLSPNNNNNNSLENSFDALESIRKNIYFGYSIIDFYTNLTS